MRTILLRSLLLPGAVALLVALLLVPAPWRPERILHGTVVSAAFGKPARWVSGSRALLRVRLADGSVVDSSGDLAILPRAGDVVRLRQRVGVFGQTLDLRPVE